MDVTTAAIPMNRARASDLRSWPGLLPAVVFVLAGGLLGFSAPATLSGQGLAFVEDPTRLLIYGGAYVWSLAWLIAHPHGVRQLALGVWPWCLLLVYVLASSLWSSYPLKVVINFGHLTGGTLVAAAAVLSVHGSAAKLAWVSTMTFGIVIGLSLAAVVAGLPNAFDLESGRWAGVTGNANTLGGVSAVLCWASTYLVLTSKGFWVRSAAFAAIGLSVVALLGSGSATSLVVTVLMCAGMCWLLLGKKEKNGLSARITLGLVFVTVVTAVGLVFAPSLFGLEAGLHVLGRSTTLSGRTELWAYGWGQFLSRPVIGHGFDSLASLLSGASIQVGQLHNGYLDLLIQGGVVAGALFALLAVRTLWRAYVLSATCGAEAVMCGMFLLGTLAHNVTESSIARPVNNLWFLCVLAILTIERLYSSRDQSICSTPITHAHSDYRSTRVAALPNLLR